MTATVAITSLTNPILAADVGAVAVAGTCTAANTVTVTATDAMGTAVGPTAATVVGTGWSISLDVAGLADGPVAFLAISTDGSATATDSQAATLQAGTQDYITPGDLRDYIGSDTTNFYPVVASACTVASRAVDSMCDRTFYAESATTTLYLDAESAYRVCFDFDIWTTTGLTLSTDDGTGTYPTSWTLNTDFVLEPENRRYGTITGYPYQSARATGTKLFLRSTPAWHHVRLVGKIGWAAVPSEAPLAALEIAAKLYKAKDAPDDYIGLDGWGPARLRAEFPMAAKILSPFMRSLISVG